MCYYFFRVNEKMNYYFVGNNLEVMKLINNYIIIYLGIFTINFFFNSIYCFF